MDVTGKYSMDKIKKSILDKKEKEFNYDAFYLKLQKFNSLLENIKKEEEQIKFALGLFSSNSIYPEPSDELKNKIIALKNSDLLTSHDLLKKILNSLENQSIIYKKIMISNDETN